MMRFLTLALVFLFMSCVDISEPEYPEHLVPKDTFVQVLCEVYLVEAVNNHQISIDEVEEGQVYAYYGEVFARYDIDPELFFESLDWYKQHPKSMNGVYNEALELMQAKRDKV